MNKIFGNSYCARVVSSRLEFRGLQNLTRTPSSIGGLVIFLGAENYNTILITTKTFYGPVKVFYTYNPTPPQPVFAEWDDIAEFSARATGFSDIYLDSEDDDLDKPINFVGANKHDCYRVRVYSRNRDKIPLELWLDAHDTPVEDLAVEIWPASPMPPKILKMLSNDSKELDEYLRSLPSESLF